MRDTGQVMFEGKGFQEVSREHSPERRARRGAREVWCSFAPSADPGVALRLLGTDASRAEISPAHSVGQELLLSPTPCAVGTHCGRRACIVGKRNSLY